jgi:hypothetical protein
VLFNGLSFVLSTCDAVKQTSVGPEASAVAIPLMYPNPCMKASDNGHRLMISLERDLVFQPSKYFVTVGPKTAPTLGPKESTSNANASPLHAAVVAIHSGHPRCMYCLDRDPRRRSPGAPRILHLWVVDFLRPRGRFYYVSLAAYVMISAIMVSYSRARAESLVGTCRVGFMERLERLVLVIIGALFNVMAPVLWVIAVLSTITVIHRIQYTWSRTRLVESNPAGSGRAA